MTKNMHTEKLDTNAKIFLESEARNIATMMSVTRVKEETRRQRTENSKGAIIGYLYCLMHNDVLSEKSVEWLTEYFTDVLPNEMDMQNSFDVREKMIMKGSVRK